MSGHSSAPPPTLHTPAGPQPPSLGAHQCKDVLDPDFLFGFATAAGQVEGAARAHGRGPSVWDPTYAEHGIDATACDSYYRMNEDIALLKALGARVYRFSLSWSRIVPLGGQEDPVESRGIEYYSRFIDGLLEAGITPFVTLFHWDLPLALQERYGGFRVIERRDELFADWERYVRICFQAFGGRVKHWITHNEPVIYTFGHALFDDDFKFPERWQVGRNLLLSHARAVDIYRKEFAHQAGSIGIALQAEWLEPIDGSAEARDAAQHGLDISVGWFADPIFLGRPNMAVETIAPHAYGFNEDEWALLTGSSDFFGVNHYSTHMVTGWATVGGFEALFGGIAKTQEVEGVPIGRRGHDGHPYDVPWGFGRLLQYIDATWTRNDVSVTRQIVPIYVLENGYAEQDERTLPLAERLHDEKRVAYFEGYLEAMAKAVAAGVCIKGYTAWSLLDNLEWSRGYDPCFGVTLVDESFKRTPKDPAWAIKRWFENAVAPKWSRL